MKFQLTQFHINTYIFDTFIERKRMFADIGEFMNEYETKPVLYNTLKEQYRQVSITTENSIDVGENQ